jgi:chromosome segregation ATPase
MELDNLNERVLKAQKDYETATPEQKNSLQDRLDILTQHRDEIAYIDARIVAAQAEMSANAASLLDTGTSDKQTLEERQAALGKMIHELENERGSLFERSNSPALAPLSQHSMGIDMEPTRPDLPGIAILREPESPAPEFDEETYISSRNL